MWVATDYFVFLKCKRFCLRPCWFTVTFYLYEWYIHMSASRLCIWTRKGSFSGLADTCNKCLLGGVHLCTGRRDVESCQSSHRSVHQTGPSYDTQSIYVSDILIWVATDFVSADETNSSLYIWIGLIHFRRDLFIHMSISSWGLSDTQSIAIWVI